MKFEYAEQVVSHIRNLYENDKRYSEFFKLQPTIHLDGEYRLSLVVWSGNGRVAVATRHQLTSNYIGSPNVVLLKYEGFDGLLGIDSC